MLRQILLRSLQRKERTLLQTSRRNIGCSRASMGDHLTITAENSRQNVTAPAVIVAITDISNTVKLLQLKVKDETFSFKAGQWVDMFIPEVETVGGFSMCSDPSLLTTSRLFHLAVKFSQHPPAYWIHTKCQIGDCVMVRAGGDFFYNPETSTTPSDILLLAGGVGINPLYSILLHFVSLTRQNSPLTKKRKATLLYSAKTVDELLFKEELKEMEKANSNLTVMLHCTQQKNHIVGDIRTDHIGQRHIQGALSTVDPSQTDVYICGPSSFINAMESSCHQFVQKHRIHYEKWW